MAGYSTTPLVRKLSIKAGTSLYVFNSPSDYFSSLGALPESVIVRDKPGPSLDFIHLALPREIPEKDGMLWVSRPKKSAKVSTDLDENIIRDVGLAEGVSKCESLCRG